MRQISSRQQEDSTRRRLIDAEDAPPPAVSRYSPFPPAMPPIMGSSYTSTDFTQRVMARLAAQQPQPTPAELRAQRLRSQARLALRIYLTLILASGTIVVLLALIAPWALFALIATVISGGLVALTLVAVVMRATGGLVSGLGMAYAAMIAALAPPLVVLAHRFRRQPNRPSRLL